MSNSALPILVVDDSVDIRMMIRIVLERAGYAPTIVATGSAALQALTMSVYALLLIDLYLPDMAGSELICQARQHPQCPPVVLMSGESRQEVRQALAAVPCVEFLPKPFSIEILLDTLEHARSHAQPPQHVA